MDRRTSSGLAVDDIVLDNGHYPYIHVDFNAFRRIKNNQSVRNLALHPELVRLGAFLAIATIADGFIYLAWAETGAIQTVHFPLLFVATNFVYLLTAIPVGNLADKLGRPVVFVLGYGCLLASYLCVVLADGFLGMTVCVIFLGLYYAATDGVLSALAAPLLPEHVRSSGSRPCRQRRRSVVRVAPLPSDSSGSALGLPPPFGALSPCWRAQY